MNDLKDLLWFLMVACWLFGGIISWALCKNWITKARIIVLMFILFCMIIFYFGVFDIAKRLKECPKIECPQIKTYEQEYQQLQSKIKTFCDEHKRASICK